MTLRQYLLLMTAGTALSWVAVWLVVANVDPHKAPLVVFGIFYASLFLSLTGTFSVIGFLLRIALLKQQLVVSRHVAISFRQSLLLSALFTISLFLKSKDLLTWWSVPLIIVGLTALEFFMISSRRREQQSLQQQAGA